jgi:hypothetical protein
MIITSIAYVLAAIALWLSAMPWWLCGVIYLALGFDLYKVLQYHGLRVHNRSVSSVWRDCDKWHYQLFNGKEFKGTLIKQRSYKSRLMLILFIAGKSHSRYVLIPCDALSQRQYRYIAMHMQS